MSSPAPGTSCHRFPVWETPSLGPSSVEHIQQSEAAATYGPKPKYSVLVH
uniref:Uncharacterized protein n=1 Tax=Arundo donax TaxID=35708 RepID=A0A0A9ESD8_ARUDO